MIRQFATSTKSIALAALLAAAGVAAQTGSASAVSLRVQTACMADYFSYCSKHSAYV